MKKGMLTIVCMLLMATLAGADTVYLKNGTIIEVNHSWEEDGTIKFYRYGTLVSYPLNDVERVEKPEAQAETKTPEELEEERLREEIEKKRKALKMEYRALMDEKQRVEDLKSEDMAKYFQEIQVVNEKVEQYNRDKEALEIEIEEFNEKYEVKDDQKKKKKK